MKLTPDIYEALRGLFATAELLVMKLRASGYKVTHRISINFPAAASV